ncbi:MAG: alpha/beta hydrolase [Myxococcales bacterium]|nr:alpha/beta hydrolase [Myxococcales bacterium]
MKLPEGEARTASGADGEVPYWAFGEGPAILFAGGLGAGRPAFYPQVAHLAARYRCLLWDYRGLYKDAPGAGAVRPVAEHARDALAILEAEGTARAAMVGWSYGVPVALSLFDQAPDRASMLVLISGGARPSWGASPEAGRVRRLYPRVFDMLARSPRLLESLVRAGGTAPEAYTWVRRVGLLGGELDHEAFAEVVRNLARIDADAWLRMAQSMAEEDLSFVLPRVDVPALVIGGDRDPFTSRAALERLVNNIAGSEYLLLPGATHYALLDHAQHVNLRIEKFFSERGYTNQAA